MDWLVLICKALFLLLIIKVLVMILRRALEPIVKNQKALADNLEKIKFNIPADVYHDMKKQIDRIC